MADPRGTAEQAAQVAEGMIQPVDYLGTQLSVATEHQVRTSQAKQQEVIPRGGGLISNQAPDALTHFRRVRMLPVGADGSNGYVEWDHNG